MALLDNISQKDYYKSPSSFGNYQFVPLEDIINQFMFAYVGDEKVISKTSRTDVAFWAQRALAEMSFDTFKSIKSQQIDVPSSLTMILPHDYVNYTKLSTVDSSGIKHLLYPTSLTSNPFQIRQEDDGDYQFPSGEDILVNSEFTGGGMLSWQNSLFFKSPGNSGNAGTQNALDTPSELYSYAFIDTGFTGNNVLYHQLAPGRSSSVARGTARCTWQEIDVTGIDFVDFEARAESTAELAGHATNPAITDSAGNIVSSVPRFTVSSGNFFATDSGNSGTLFDTLSTQIGAEGTVNNVTIPATTIRVGLSTRAGGVQTDMDAGLGLLSTPTRNDKISIFDIFKVNQTGDVTERAYLEWTGGEKGYQNMSNVDVRNHDKVYLLICSIAPWTDVAWGEARDTLFVKTQIDELTVTNQSPPDKLQEISKKAGTSSTWENYKANPPSEIQNDDYEDDVYWPYHGERYGLEPSQAQVNGSFYIDELRGNLHFSSNISGKTVILDYISDSLGTDAEMQVHKFAEDAMYKSILCDIMSARRNVGRREKMLYKKDKFAAIRKAKLRLSNVKLEELTQILRGRSKWIKH